MSEDPLLREVREEDFSIFFEQQDDPVARHMVAFATESTHDREAYFAHWRDVVLADETGVKRTLVWEGQVAGYLVCFHRGGRQQVGYYLGRDYWGRGLATRGLREMLTLIEERPLYGCVAADNEGSRRVLEKCGFVLIGEEQAFARSRGETIRELILRLDATG